MASVENDDSAMYDIYEDQEKYIDQKKSIALPVIAGLLMLIPGVLVLLAGFLISFLGPAFLLFGFNSNNFTSISI